MAQNAKPKEEAEKTGKIESHVCDQGHYGMSYCGECRYDVSKLDPMPTHCPNCHVKFLPFSVDDATHNQGGSDF